MKIIEFAKSLISRVDKDKVLEDLRVTKNELEQIVEPNYDQAAVFFRTYRIASSDNKYLLDVFYRNFEVRGSKQGSIVCDVEKVLPDLRKNITYLSTQIEAVLEQVAVNEGLTAKKAILLRAAEHVSFISRFSIDLLNLIYVNESTAVNADLQESMNLTPIQIQNVNKNIAVYATLLSEYAQKPEDFQKCFLKIPDVVISSKGAQAISGVYNERDIDPFASSYVSGFMGSPIYHVRLMVAEWQANRYRVNKDKKKVLELRLLHLKLLQEKKNDPKLEQEINYVQSRVDKINAYLREVEESVDSGE